MARILIIDDEVEFREVIVQALGRKGHQTSSAGDTDEGFKLATQMVPDLIISDICMAGGDGFGLLARIRKDSRTSTVPFIVMTGQPDVDGITTVAEFAADGYLPKPFKLQTLLATVESRLEREKNLRRRVREMREQLQRILEASPDLIGIIDPDSHHFLFLNPAGRTLLGIAQDEDLSGLRTDELHLDEGVALLKEIAIPTALSTGIWAGENTLLTFDGRQIPVKQFLQAHRDGSGAVAFLSTIAHDLTEEKKSESALRASEARFRLLLDSLPDAVVMHDRTGRILFSNARTERIFGYSPGEMTGRSIADFFAESVEHPEGEVYRAHYETRWRRKDGGELPVDLVENELEINGERTRLSIIRDVSERKRMERERQNMEIQLRQASKLESIGQLAAGIAHEINTPAQYIGDNTRFLLDAFASLARLLPEYEKVVQAATAGRIAPELLQRLEQCRAEADVDYLMKEIPLAIQQSLEGADRVTKIVRAMKDFSHPGVTEKALADLNHLIQSTLTVARNEWKYVADLQTDFDVSLPPIPCLPGEFNQVILNLVVNAAHAIASAIGEKANRKGTIRVVTRKAGDFAEIQISDTGTGIPVAVRGKIFEPFFTTKDVGKGTGQGLAISRSVIVDKHGGTIDFQTEIGQGTTFIVRLPLAGA